MKWKSTSSPSKRGAAVERRKFVEVEASPRHHHRDSILNKLQMYSIIKISVISNRDISISLMCRLQQVYVKCKKARQGKPPSLNNKSRDPPQDMSWTNHSTRK